MQRLVLIDGNAILHRAYHALPPFTTKSGEPVGAVFGFTSMLLKVLADLKPTYLVVAFDRPAPTFRQELFVGYQAGRPAMPEDLIPQVEGVHRILEALNIAIFEVDGYEADDIIGTLAFQARSLKSQISNLKSQKLQTIIVSGDRDMLQLVNDQVRVYAPIVGLTKIGLYDKKAIEEKYGIKPQQIIDYKALIGDPSDNYPGVSGIGPKTAALLLEKYKTLENIYQHLPSLSEKQAKALVEGTENAGLAKKLAAIVTDVPITLRLDECRFQIKDKKRVVKTLQRFEFRTLTNRFLALMNPSTSLGQEGKPLEAVLKKPKPTSSNSRERVSGQLHLV